MIRGFDTDHTLSGKPLKDTKGLPPRMAGRYARPSNLQVKIVLTVRFSFLKDLINSQGRLSDWFLWASYQVSTIVMRSLLDKTDRISTKLPKSTLVSRPVSRVHKPHDDTNHNDVESDQLQLTKGVYQQLQAILHRMLGLCKKQAD